MQSTGHDASLAALQASARLPGHVLDVIALTQDPGLLATLRQACAPQHAFWHASSADAAVDLLVGGRCGILIADLTALRSDAASLLERLRGQFPELVLTAAGRREEEASIASLMDSGAVHRFLHKPVSPARAGQFITAATQQYARLLDAPGLALSFSSAAGAEVEVKASRHPRGVMIGTAALLTAVIALAVWRWGDELPSAAAERARIDASDRKEQIAEYLARAHRAYAAGRLTLPAGDNALEHFRAVLALQSDNARARQGVDLVMAALEARLTQALQSGNAAQGAAAFTALQRADPQHPRLEELRARLLSISRSAGRHAPRQAAPERSS